MPSGQKQPRVSVIIPTFNRSALLRQAVESVLAQSYPHVEIIVVDDGSVDDTPAVVGEYAGRVLYVRQANRGVSAARNVGFRSASGQYINFLDDDDLFLPAKIAHQVRVLEARPEVGLVHCGYYRADLEGRLLRKVVMLPEGEVLVALLKHCFPLIHTPLVRRDVLEQVGLFDASLGWHEDWDLWLRIARAGHRFGCVQAPLCTYRMQPDSKMSSLAEIERGAFVVLDGVFADARLPPHALAAKGEAYARTHLWIGWKYYGAGLWEDAQRNLTEALACWPRLAVDAEELQESLCGEAANMRRDPLAFASDVLDHLPPRAEGLRLHRDRILAQVRVALALRRYELGRDEEAREGMAEAVALSPALLEEGKSFARMLRDHAVGLPLASPSQFVEKVLQHLPPAAQRLARVRGAVLSDVMIARAFEAYHTGRRRKVPGQILTALRHRPSQIGNRGVQSMLVKSLPALLARPRAQGFL